MNSTIAFSVFMAATTATLAGSFAILAREHADPRTTPPCYAGAPGGDPKSILTPQNIGYCAGGVGPGWGIPVSCETAAGGTTWTESPAGSGFWNSGWCHAIRLPHSTYYIQGVQGPSAGVPPPDGTYYWSSTP